MSDASAVAWSCVVDDKDAIWDGFKVWAASLIACAGVDPARIVVHHVAPLRADVEALCERLALRTVPVAPFDKRSPHSNKIVQCQTDFGDVSRVVLTDADLAFLSPLPIEQVCAPVAGKPVDRPNPPISILRDLFDRASLPHPPETIARSFANGRFRRGRFETFPANFNGGFYLLDRSALKEFGDAWASWTRWLLDEAPPLGDYGVFVDQIGFCMATHALGLATQTLDDRWNMPTHIPTSRFDPVPYVLHHHGRLDRDLEIMPPIPARHRRLLRKSNSTISGFLRSRMSAS